MNTPKTLLSLIFLAVLPSLHARQLWLAPDGTGNGRSIEKPMGNVQKAVDMLQPGDTLWVRGGTYLLSQKISVTKTGTRDKRICMFALPDEQPVFDFSLQDRTSSSVAGSNRGFLHKKEANYWHYRGLTFCNAADNGMKLEGSYCVVERCVFHDNGDTGLQQGFSKGDNGENTGNPDLIYGRSNIVVNCDSYNNYDPWTNGGNADGFACKLYPGPGNEYHGCRAWNNSDDGWDMYYPVFPVVIENCWALYNGYDPQGNECGNGNGIKFGGLKQGGNSVGAHVFIRNIAAYNLKKGFDQNHHQEGSFMFNCLAFNNYINYAFNMEAPVYANWVLRNCTGFAPSESNHRFTIVPDASHCNWLDIDKLNPLRDGEGGAGYNKYTHEKWPDYSQEFENISYAAAIAPRQANGELPTTFARLKSTSRFIDRGTPIDNFPCPDNPNKPDYNPLPQKADYSHTVTLAYSGGAPDYGPFETAMADPVYELVMPENDGTAPEVEPEPDEDEGKLWDEFLVINNYLFQDEVLPDSVAQFFTATSELDGQGPKPQYYGKNGDLATGKLGDKYGATTTFGAYRIPKTGWVELTMPSLASLRSNIYCTGNRTLKVSWHNEDNTQSGTQTLSMSTGTAGVDLASMAKTTKKPITVRIENVESKGDMFLTDLTIGIFIEVDEDGKPVGISTLCTNPSRPDIYQLDNAFIVYGDISRLCLYNMQGRRVAASQLSQYISTANLPRGPYILIATMKDGTTQSMKIMRR